MAIIPAVVVLATSKDNLEGLQVGQILPIQNVDEIRGYRNDVPMQLGNNSEDIVEYEIMGYFPKENITVNISM